MTASKKVKRQNITSWPELGINYWGINKNATSTMMNHFAVLTGNINAQEILINSQAGKKTVGKRYISIDTALTNGLKNFAIVRDPALRFESCWRHFKYATTPVLMVAPRKARFDPDWTAQEFLENIQIQFAKGLIGNKHWQTQCSFLTHPDRLDYIVKIESLEQDWPLDIPTPLFKSNTTDPVEKVHYKRKYLRTVYQQDYDTFDY